MANRVLTNAKCLTFLYLASIVSFLPSRAKTACREDEYFLSYSVDFPNAFCVAHDWYFSFANFERNRPSWNKFTNFKIVGIS